MHNYCGIIILIFAHICVSDAGTDIWQPEGTVLPQNHVKTRGWQPEERILNGRPAPPDSAPYAAFIGVINTKWEFSKCTGSLISNRHILTAAHCLQGVGSMPYKILVTLGAHNIKMAESRGLQIYGEKYAVHKGFIREPYYFVHDIGIIRLQQEVIPDQTYIDIVKLPYSMYNNDYAGQTATVYGWGWLHTLPFSRDTDVLMTVDVPVMAQCPYEGCLCTGIFNGQTTCLGDSGGPLIMNGVQIGVVNGGRSNSKFCEHYSQNVFASVPYYLQWIQNTMAGINLDTYPFIPGMERHI